MIQFFDAKFVNIFNNYAPMFTEPEANSCFNIIFRGEYQGVKHKYLFNVKFIPLIGLFCANVLLVVKLNVSNCHIRGAHWNRGANLKKWLLVGRAN